MGRKSRHYRDESDPLLGLYSQTLAETSSVRNPSNALYACDENSIRQTNSSGGNETSPLKNSFQIFRPSVVGSPDNDSIQSEEGRKGKGTVAVDHHQQRQRGRHRHHRQSPDDVVKSRQQRQQQSSSTSSQSSFGKNEEKKKKEKKNTGYRVHRVSYTAQNHIQVLFRMYGSAFPQVLPFCIANVIWMFIVVILKENNVVDLSFHSSIGHSFMGLLVSFLIVSRSRISYDRFMEFRRHLAVTYRTCREIAQFTTTYTYPTQTEKAQKWRQEVCYRTILLLRVTMDALLWSATEREHWEDEYFKYYPEKDGNSGGGISKVRLFGEGGEDENNNNNEDVDGDDEDEEEDDNNDDVSEHFFRFRELSHGRRSMIDENFRAPITFQHILRLTIMDHPKYLGYKMPVNEYRDLLNFVTQFNDAYHSFRVLIFTPYPFPLVQMTRAFLFFWVYTLPLVLLKDYRIMSSLVIVLLVSFGFIGIEYVSMALDDPLGDDTNDIDEHGMSLLVYEDIYLAIYRADGPAAAFALRDRVLARYKKGRALDCYRSDLKGSKLWGQQQPRETELNGSVDPTSNIV